MDVVGASTVDGVPQGTDFIDRHPVLGIQENDGIDLTGRQAVKELPEIGMMRNDQSRAVAHTLILPTLQIGRQATVARTDIAAMERLPGKVIGFVGMAVDQAQQARMKDFVQRSAAAQ
jgi:hypothetical protein